MLAGSTRQEREREPRRHVYLFPTDVMYALAVGIFGNLWHIPFLMYILPI